MRLFKLLLLLSVLTLVHPLYSHWEASGSKELLGDLKIIQDSGRLRIGILESSPAIAPDGTLYICREGGLILSRSAP